MPPNEDLHKLVQEGQRREQEAQEEFARQLQERLAKAQEQARKSGQQGG